MKMNHFGYKPLAFVALAAGFGIMGMTTETATAGSGYGPGYGGYNKPAYYGQRPYRGGYQPAYRQQRPAYAPAYRGYPQQPYAQSYGPAYNQAAPAAQTAQAASAAAIEADVSIAGMRFEPAVIRVKAGEEVTWVNEERAPHTVTSKTGDILASSMMNTGNSFSFTFTEPGTYEYYCSVHPMMTGQVIVE